MLSAYKDLNQRVEIASTKAPSIEIVESALSTRFIKFTKSQLIGLCPSLSIKSI